MNTPSKQTDLIIPGTELKISFPAIPSALVPEKKGTKIQDAITKHGMCFSDGSTFVDKRAIPTLCQTNASGTGMILNDISEDEKRDLPGGHQAVAVPALEKIISERIEEPRTTTEREILKYSAECLDALRDAPVAESIRSERKEEIDKGLSSLKAKKMRSENITADQLTGEPLAKNAAFHHIERKVDKPRRALDISNGIIVNPTTHDIIHSHKAESADELRKLCKEEGWYIPDEISPKINND